MQLKDEQEPIAIIGAACRLPGEVSSLGTLWDMISNERTGHCKVPSDRWDGDLLHHPDADRKGTMAVKHGYFLQQDISHFDAPFFSTTAKEAAALDPMKRLLLEVSYESIENAGIPMKSLINSDTGCYVGCMTNDYEMLSTQDIQDMGYSAATGLSEAMIANRVSWFFGLRGPSLTLDTACSSSLYALHLACQALKLKETNQALVAGVNLILYPNCMEQFSGIHMLSPEGISHSFDDRANGYGRGEGIGCMVVKRLSDALRDGDTIRAVIRHTGVNADGKTPSITQPSSEAQADLIRRTYKAAGLSLSSTEYFESHGTGTPVGDPIELNALASTIGAARRAAGLGPLYFGSVKPSVGHTEGCSGLAGVFKSILCLEKGMLVPTYGVENINPRLSLNEWNLALPPKTMSWPSRGRRRISVNSFGFGGANAHVILDDAYHYLSDRGLTGNHNTSFDEDDGSESGISVGASTPLGASMDLGSRSRLFVFSTQDQAGLKRISNVFNKDVASSGLDKTDPLYLQNLAYTLAERRTHHDFRAFAVATSLTELGTELTKPIPKLKRISRRAKNLAFVFTGQGAQWPAMGRELMSYTVFERSVKDSQHYLEEHGCPWNAIEELQKVEGSQIGLPEYSQTLCTVLQVALVDLLRDWNVMPTAVVGHSSGEIAAAYAASYITHSDAVKIAYVRGVSSASVTEQGAMMAAGLSREEAKEYLSRIDGVAVTACVNSPKSVTLSGDVEAIDTLAQQISADGKFARKLKVKTAYHSPHMLQVSEDYFKRMGEITTLPGGDTVMFSSLTGRMVAPAELNAQYWVDNMCNTVEFSEAVTALLAYTGQTDGKRTGSTPIQWTGMVEVGPHAALQGPVQQNIEASGNAAAKEAPYVSLVTRGADANTSALGAAGKLWATGLDVDLRAVNGLTGYSLLQAPKVLVELPTYPWNHSRSYWHEASATRSIRFPIAARTDLLGMPEDVQNRMQPRWKNYLRISENPWIEDHKITGTVLYPGAGMLIMALEGAHQISDSAKKVHGFRFRNVAFERGLVVSSGDEEAAVETRLTFIPNKLIPDEFHFTVFSYNSNTWTQHCNGIISIEYDVGQSEIDGPDSESSWIAKCEEYKSLCQSNDAEEFQVDDFYDHLESNGMEYGPMFRNVDSLFCVPSKLTAHGSITIPDTESVMPANFEYPHIIHPATMDAIFHLLLAAAGDGRPTQEAAVPFALKDMFVSAHQASGPGSKFCGYSQLTSKIPSRREVSLSLVVSDETWSAPKIVANGFALRQVTSADNKTADVADGLADLRKSALVSWCEDLDFVDAEGSVSESENKPKSATNHLNRWLDRLTHKKPVEHTLLLIEDVSLVDSELMQSILSRVNRKPGFNRLSVSTTSSASVSKLTDICTGHPVDATLWDPSSSNSPVSSDAQYDLIVALSHSNLATNLDLLEGLEKNLRTGGYLAIQLSHGHPVDGCHKTIESLSLTVTNSTFESQLLIASKGEASTKSLPGEVFLLVPQVRTEKLESLIFNLSEALTLSNVDVKLTIQGHDGADVLADKYVISLLEIDSPFIYEWDADQFFFFKTLISTAKHLMWITKGSLMESWMGGVEFAAAQGLLRVMRNEYPLASLPHLDLSTAFDLSLSNNAKLLIEVFTASLTEGAEMEYAELNGAIHIPRAIEHSGFDHELQLASGSAQPVQRLMSEIKAPMKAISIVHNGDFLWTENPTLETIMPDEVEIKVECFGLRGLDVSSRFADDPAIDTWTNDVVGVVQRCGTDVTSLAAGQRVVAYQVEGYATHARVKSSFVAQIPDQVAPDQIAGLTSSLVAARYALLHTARLGAGKSVLIHNAASALGQAAIQISKFAGAQVFAMVGSKDEKDILMANFDITPSNIFDSNRRHFLGSVMELTGGRGVDVILCNHATTMLQPSLDTLADFGQVVELVGDSRDLPMIALPSEKRNASLIRLDMETLRHREPLLAGSLFQDAMAGPAAAFLPKPIQSSIIAGQASKTSSPGRNGANVLILDEGSTLWTVPPPIERLVLDSEATYILAGGFGAVGLNIADMMVKHGAKHLVFLSRSGGVKNQHDIQRFSDLGVMAEAFKCDVNNSTEVESICDKLKQDGRVIKGIVQCAMVLENELKDSIFDNMTPEKWARAFTPKSKGSRNLLQQLSATDSPFFILLSSITGVIGNTAQANYASGNTFEDALAQYARSNLGISATSLDVGLVSDSSHFTTNGGFGDLKDYLHRYQHGWVGLRCTLEELSVALQAIMRGSTTNGDDIPAQLVFGLGDNLARTEGSTGFQRDRKFDLRVQRVDENDTGKLTKVNVGDMLSKATSLNEAANIVENIFKAQIAAEFGVEVGEVDTQRPLPELGVDSLKAVEIRNRALKEMQSDVSVFELLSATPLTEVAMKIASRSSFLTLEKSKGE